MTFPTVDPNMDEMDEIRPKMQYLWASPTLGTIHVGHPNHSKQSTWDIKISRNNPRETFESLENNPRGINQTRIYFSFLYP